jgi:hypothetical protein
MMSAEAIAIAKGLALEAATQSRGHDERSLRAAVDGHVTEKRV